MHFILQFTNIFTKLSIALSYVRVDENVIIKLTNAITLASRKDGLNGGF